MEPTSKNDKDEMSDGESRRLSTCSSPSSSCYKMSVDSDDARSTCSTKSIHKQYSTTTTKDEVLYLDPITRPNNTRRSYDFRERPERRSVNRRSSLLVKSKICIIPRSVFI